VLKEQECPSCAVAIRHTTMMAELERKIEGELEKAAATITDVKDVEQGRLNQSIDL
jgi:hypothetical protein